MTSKPGNGLAVIKTWAIIKINRVSCITNSKDSDEICLDLNQHCLQVWDQKNDNDIFLSHNESIYMKNGVLHIIFSENKKKYTFDMLSKRLKTLNLIPGLDVKKKLCSTVNSNGHEISMAHKN